MNRSRHSAVCTGCLLLALASCTGPSSEHPIVVEGGGSGRGSDSGLDGGPPDDPDSGASADPDSGGNGDLDSGHPIADGGELPADPVDAGSLPLEPVEQDGLPVLHLWTSPDINDAAYTPARFAAGGREYAAVQAKFRGKTALRFPKKSFTVKLAKHDLFSDPARDFHDKRRLVLIASYDDNTYLRPRLAFELWNLLEPRIKVQIYNAVVFLNGEYHGLYLVCDHVDDELMEASELWSGGNLYKARTHDANLRLTDRAGKTKARLELGYTKEEGKPEAGEAGAFDDLGGLVTWISTAPDAQIVDELDTVLDRADFESWFMLVSTIDANDSAGKNGYLYHDPRPGAPDARWHYVPWDFNASFGQNWRMVHVGSAEPLAVYAPKNALFERMNAIPELSEPLARRFVATLADTWELSKVIAMLDAYADEIEAAAPRDEALWGESVRAYDWGGGKTEFTTHDQELVYLRLWIEARWAQAHAEYP